MRNIICISGGLASAWVAKWAVDNRLENTVFYFNDTGWEHEDLYRFLGDLERALDIHVMQDSDGRTPEEVAFDQHFLPNNRVPLCSRVLKAERLQKFAEKGDVCWFGIDETEAHRAVRVAQIYQRLEVGVRFPLIEQGISKDQVRQTIEDLDIEIPLLYRLGFPHNNCSGGCVRAGQKTWKLLLDKLPEVYEKRERFEEEFRGWSGKNATFMKGESLAEFRVRMKAKDAAAVQDDEVAPSECVGICTTEN